MRIRPGQVWKLLSEDEVVITSKGRPIALVTKVNPDTLEREIAQLRKARALAALEDIQREAVRTGRERVQDDAIDREVQAVRKARRR